MKYSLRNEETLIYADVLYISILNNIHIEYFFKYSVWIILIKYINIYLLGILYEYQDDILKKFFEGMYRYFEHK